MKQPIRKLMQYAKQEEYMVGGGLKNGHLKTVSCGLNRLQKVLKAIQIYKELVVEEELRLFP